MYELQLFDDMTGQYVPVETGDDPHTLMDLAKGMARRVINALRGQSDYSPRFGMNYAKPLPLKPRIPYGLSGKPRRYRPDTMIEPASPEELAYRAIKYYETRAKSGETDIPVYVWRGTTFAQAMHILSARPETYNVIELNPNDYL